MKDRNVQFPNRFKMTLVPGTTDIVDLTPAPGEVYEEGTFWNKSNVLKDATAALYGKGSSASPDEIFAAIAPMLQATQNAADKKLEAETGSYLGTGKYGVNEQNSLVFKKKPYVVFISRPGGRIGLFVYPGTLALTLSYGDNSSSLNVSWGDKKMSWYYSGTYEIPEKQLNEKDVRYDYIAIG